MVTATEIGTSDSTSMAEFPVSEMGAIGTSANVPAGTMISLTFLADTPIGGRVQDPDGGVRGRHDAESGNEPALERVGVAGHGGHAVVGRRFVRLSIGRRIPRRVGSFILTDRRVGRIAFADDSLVLRRDGFCPGERSFGRRLNDGADGCVRTDPHGERRLGEVGQVDPEGFDGRDDPSVGVEDRAVLREEVDRDVPPTLPVLEITSVGSSPGRLVTGKSHVVD